MTLKEFLKKLPFQYSKSNEKRGGLNFSKNFSLVIYPVIIIISFVVYNATYKSINNQKSKNAKNLERFFSCFKLVKGIVLLP